MLENVQKSHSMEFQIQIEKYFQTFPNLQDFCPQAAFYRGQNPFPISKKVHYKWTLEMNVGNSPFYAVKVWIFPESKLKKKGLYVAWVCFARFGNKDGKWHKNQNFQSSRGNLNFFPKFECPFFQFGFWKYSHFDSIEQEISNIHFQSQLKINFFGFWKWTLPTIESSISTNK